MELVKDRRCIGCMNFWLNPQDLSVGTCRANPPAVFVVGVHPQNGPITISVWPTVGKELLCAKYDPKPTVQ